MADINIDLDDLANAVTSEISCTNNFSRYEKEALIELRDELNKKFSQNPEALADNLGDQMKMEFLMELSQKYNEDQLRKMEIEFKEKNCPQF